ncbi:MAG: glycine/D-amino acid oxidase-like deaminating enzyme [Gammaproteobacteria bacterium]|jgi:glycine/D-amino acid oxidase-like deaminating enzyme
MTQTKQTIAIVGAGLVGLSCAIWLQKKGFPIVLIDPEGPGSGTSSGNACTIADYATVPVNNPSIFRRLPSLIFSKNTPLTLDPWYALTHPDWSFRFLSNCRQAKVKAISDSLAELLAKTYQGFSPLIEMTGTEDLIQQQGCMYVYKTQQEFDAARTANDRRKALGISLQEVSSDEIRELEPKMTMRFEKGILFDQASQVLNPETLCQRYFKFLLDNNSQYIRAKAQNVEVSDHHIRVQLDNGDSIKVNKLVVAAGAFSRSVTGTGAEKLPLDTERGYHVQFNGVQHLLNRPVSWNEAGFYATPMNEGLRFAGTVEIGGYHNRKNSKNITYLIRHARQMFDLPEQPDQDWLGFRPTFPDALPVIDYSPRSKNILFAFGHQHIGLTLSGITGKLIAELANNEKPSHNINSFRASRF